MANTPPKQPKSAGSRTRHPKPSERIDEQAVRERLEVTIKTQFGEQWLERVMAARFGGKKRGKPVLPEEVRRVVRRAGVKLDTFYRKIIGSRPITAADVSLFARAFHVNPTWLATGHGGQEGFSFALYFDAKALDVPGDQDVPDDGDAPELPVVTAGWVESRTKRRPRGRPRKHPEPPPPPFGPRVTGDAKLAQRLALVRELDELLSGTPEFDKLKPGEPDPRLALLADRVLVELKQPQPRRDVLNVLLAVAEPLEREATEGNYLPLTNKLKAVLGNLDREAPNRGRGPA